MSQATILNALLASLPPVSYDTSGPYVVRETTVQAYVLAQPEALDDAILTEQNPQYAVQTISDWERVLGLPDCCTTTAQTLLQRQTAAFTKWVTRGGLSKPSFISLAGVLGYVATITEYADTTFRWRINLPMVNLWVFSAGHAVAGDPLRRWGDPHLECVFNRLKPAHTRVLFGYGP